MPNAPARKRTWFLAALILVILAGLASRRYPLFPAALGKYPGDALWAIMVFVGWGFIFPRRPTLQILALALATAYAIEFFKFYRAPWIDELRASTVGHLIFGASFSWQNLIAYTIGAAIGALLDQSQKDQSQKD